MIARSSSVAILLMVASGASQAQVRVAPYAAATLGITDLRTRVPIQTSPPSKNFAATHSQNILAGVNLGVAIGNHVTIDASLRSTLGIRQPFRVLTAGVGLEGGRRARAQIRGGLGWVQGFEAVTCIDGGDCAPPSEWRAGLDLSAGINFPAGARWHLGPQVWWAQSLGSGKQYRSAGLGLRIGYH